MSTELDDATQAAVDGDQSSTEVVAVSPVVRRGLLAAVVLLGGVLLVTLVAALLGDGDEEVADDPALVITTTTTTAVVTTTTEAAPVTTDTTTTTTTEAVVASEVFAATPSNTDLALWNYNQQDVLIVDVDAAEVSTLDMTTVGVPLVERIISTGDLLVVQSLGDYFVVTPDGERLQLDTRGVVQAFGDDEVWVTSGFIGDQPVSPIRIDFSGERRVLPEVPENIFPFGWVGDRLLVGGGRTGGIYIETEAGDGYEFLTDGELLASRDGFLLTRVCDERLQCSIRRIDLDAGTVTVHELPSGFSMNGLWWLDDTTSPTLDAVLGVSSELGAPALWDLLTGELQALAISQGRGAAFSPDGQWVFVSVADSVIAYHRPTGQEVVVPIPGGLDAPNGLQIAALVHR